jgi:hypothetical protein
VPREERREGEGIRTGLCCRWEKRKGGRGSTQRGDRIRPRWRRWIGWRSSTAACGGIQDAWIFAAGGGEDGGTAANHSAEKQSSARGGREREFLKDLFVILENCRDLPVKKNLTTVLGLKQKCDQNESCTTFQTLQLCFRV